MLVQNIQFLSGINKNGFFPSNIVQTTVMCSEFRIGLNLGGCSKEKSGPLRGV